MAASSPPDQRSGGDGPSTTTSACILCGSDRNRCVHCRPPARSGSEALWLVNDGVATTEEIDDAIRYGFGLRWAQMGLFETYRIAGGTGGMRHFISQFGECLSWPWTKLTDVPDLTDELIDKIADQSDDQSGHRDVANSNIRDKNIGGDPEGALETNRWGAGNTLANLRNR
ncbi:MAG: 3-hydroxyacyl-CoA dehydrogenase family protein [Acidimicrobiales bacterium]